MTCRRGKMRSFWIILFFMLIVLSVAYHIMTNYVFVLSTTRYRLIENSNVVREKNTSKIHILFWNELFDSKYWEMENETNSEEYFKAIKCPMTNCLLTHNKEFLEAPHLYDAIVFHSAEPWLKAIPETRSPNQYYVMATKESPAELKHNLELDANFFNLTMTYRLDSDIVWTYGRILDKETNSLVAPGYNIKWRNPEEVKDKDIHSLVLNKTKPNAWFVSHCNVHSKRENLVKEIQKFMDVDVYGKCGPLSCPRDSDICSTMLNTTYYFYFSFENSLCKDYVTEKLYKTMSDSYVIPVVFNGVLNMKKFVPPRSYIDANSFRSAAELTDYLEYLIQNPDEYMSYFWWKKYYKIIFPGDDYTYCNLCMKLNEMIEGDRGQYYINISNWFYRNSCKNPRIKF